MLRNVVPIRRSLIATNIFTKIKYSTTTENKSTAKQVEQITSNINPKDILRETETFDNVLKHLEEKRYSKTTASKEWAKKLEVIFDGSTTSDEHTLTIKNDNKVEENSESLLLNTIRGALGLDGKKEVNFNEVKQTTSSNSLLDDMKMPPLNFKLNLPENTLKIIQFQEDYKKGMDKVMEPYTRKLLNTITNDFELLEYFNKTLTNYKPNQDIQIPQDNLDELFQIIKADLESKSENDLTIPQPYKKTLPYIVTKIFQLPEFQYPHDRQYTLISFIYNTCKRFFDLSLYLDVCNVDFYNILLKLTWQNYSNLSQLNNLVSEMKFNGIVGNLDTIKILEDAISIFEDVGEEVLDIKDVVKPNPPILMSGILWSKEAYKEIDHLKKYITALKNNLV